MIKKVFTLITAGLLLQTTLFAQDTLPGPKQLGVSAKMKDNSVLLKISIPESSAWINFTNNGWNIQRAEINIGDTTEFNRLNDEPLMPASRAELEDLAQQYTSADGMLEMLYPEEQPQAPQGFAGQLEADFTLSGRSFFYMFLSADNRAVSEASGLEYTDNTAESDQRYVYRAYIGGFENDDGHWGATSVNTRFLPDKFRAPEIIGGALDHAVVLEWNHSDYENVFLSYNIEKAEDGENFDRINKTPLVFNKANDRPAALEGKMDHVDSLDYNYRFYHYRLIGNDYFGEDSEPSNVLRLAGRDFTPPDAAQNVKAEATENGVEVSWDYGTVPEDFRGFFVLKSNESPGGPFRNLNREGLDGDTRTFTDAEPSVHGRNYYAVMALDTANNYANSESDYAFIPDSIPPAVPTGLSANVDSSGVVILNWEMGTEPDLKGYRVFKSLRPDHKFVQITERPININGYPDTITLSSLDRYVYYKVVALDQNFNHSDYSKALKVKRPDTIAPSAPLLENIGWENQTVNLGWRKSSSDDIAAQQVLRKPAGGNEEWTVATELNNISQSSYADDFNPEAMHYEYAIAAVDSSGLESISNVRRVRVQDFENVKTIEELSANYSPDNNEVNISWEYEMEPDSYRILVYRAAKKGEAMELYDSAEGADAEYTDNNLQREKTYFYSLVVKLKEDGRTSEKSKIVKVEM